MGVLGRTQDGKGGVHGGDCGVGFEGRVLGDIRTPRTPTAQELVICTDLGEVNHSSLQRSPVTKILQA